ncbi:MAG TPA: hypothetical protein VIK53_07920 [Verrucomicrobiae bacterium]
MSTVAEINEAIEKLDVADQVQLLQNLPQHLKIQPGDPAWLKLATALPDEQFARCYEDNDWAAFENRCGAASD